MIPSAARPATTFTAKSAKSAKDGHGTATDCA